MRVMLTPCQDGESLKATHKSSIRQRERVVRVSRDRWGERETQDSKREGYHRSEKRGQLPSSPQCGHLYGVRLIIPYPQTWRADAVTLKACVCMCACRACVCLALFGCAFLMLKPSICVCACPRVCMWVFGRWTQTTCVRVCWHSWHILSVYRRAAGSYRRSPWQPGIIDAVN